jgi:hypothetical protein
MQVIITTPLPISECQERLDTACTTWLFSAAPLFGDVSDRGFRLAMTIDVCGLGFAAVVAKGKYVQQDGGTAIEIERGRHLVQTIVGYDFYAVGIIAILIGVLSAIAGRGLDAVPGLVWASAIAFPIFGYVILHCSGWLSTKRDWSRLVGEIAKVIDGEIVAADSRKAR